MVRRRRSLDIEKPPIFFVKSQRGKEIASVDEFLFHHTSTDEAGIRTFRCKNRRCKLVGADITYKVSMLLLMDHYFYFIFKKAPLPFAKLMSVHGRFRGKFVPLAFILLHKDPDQAVYEEIFTMLPRMENLEAIVVDFDLAQINAIRHLYPTVSVSFLLISYVE